MDSKLSAVKKWALMSKKRGVFSLVLGSLLLIPAVRVRIEEFLLRKATSGLGMSDAALQAVKKRISLAMRVLIALLIGLASKIFAQELLFAKK